MGEVTTSDAGSATDELARTSLREAQQLLREGDPADVAKRARRLWRRGELAAAVARVVALAEVTSTPFLERWLPTWLAPAGALESLPAELALELLRVVAGRFPEHREATRAQRRTLRRFVRLAVRYVRAFPRSELGDVYVGAIVRKAGLLERAVEFGRGAVARHRGWQALLALGSALGERGDLAGAERVYRRALRRAPDYVEPWLELGDLFCRHGRWRRAAEFYGQVLPLDPEHPWALPSALFCRWRARAPDQATLPGELAALIVEGNLRALELAQAA